ncbi:MAG: ATP-binding cassette domain-containing protein [Thermomicrobia bacterium]|nr:ATP-binding cassette domain-containing protein [Thermomicrobia bacterium]
MFTVTDVAKAYGDAPILDHISFTLNRGERVGLIGPNGAGKSTLLRILAGLEAPDCGSVWLDPAARIGYLAQALRYGADATIHDVVSEALGEAREVVAAIERLGEAIATAQGAAYDDAMAQYADALDRAEQIDAYGASARLVAVLAGLGLAHLTEETPVATLSGGQKTRLGLARLLLTQPDVLLLDEPTNHLDLTALHWLEALLRDYPGAVLIVSHDRAFLDALVLHILALDDATHTITAYPGNYSAYADERARRAVQLLDDYRRQQEQIAEVRANIRAVAGNAMKTERATQNDHLRRLSKKVARTAKVRERKLEKLLASEEHIERPERQWRLKLDFGASPRGGQRVLALEGISKQFDGHALFTGVEAEIRHGERVALLGPNGSGKTTLLRIISGALPPDSGAVRIGASVRPGYFAQEQEGLDPNQTVLDAVRAAAPIGETEARNFLHFFLFAADAVFRPIGQLSYGERARLVLARLVLGGVNFLLLDEPLNHLDIPAREQFEAALENFDGTILTVVHDRYFVQRFAGRIWALEDGKLVQHLDLEAYENVFAKEHLMI